MMTEAEKQIIAGKLDVELVPQGILWSNAGVPGTPEYRRSNHRRASIPT
jgi:hypothetical protein